MPHESSAAADSSAAAQVLPRAVVGEPVDLTILRHREYRLRKRALIEAAVAAGDTLPNYGGAIRAIARDCGV